MSLEVTGLVPRFAEAVGESERLRALSSGLAGCVEEPRLLVRYSGGQGIMALRGRWTGCLPSSGSLAPLVPAGLALARYRDGLASFEPLLARFVLQLELGDCALTLAGQVPPDGSTFLDCVQREEPCPASLRGVTALTEPARQALERCLAPR